MSLSGRGRGGCLLTFFAFRIGAYSRLVRINTITLNVRTVNVTLYSLSLIKVIANTAYAIPNPAFFFFFFFFDKSSDEEMSEMTCDEYLVRMKRKKHKT